MNSELWLPAVIYLRRSSTGRLLALPGTDETAKKYQRAKCILGVSNISNQLEDSDGLPAAGGCQIDLVDELVPELNEFSGGFLEDCDPDVETIFVIIELIHKGLCGSIIFTGKLRAWTHSWGDKALTLSCDGGLTIYKIQDINPIFPLADGLNDVYGAKSKDLFEAIIVQMDSPVGLGAMLPYVLDPTIEAGTPFWSYFQKPDTMWCDNPPSDMPNQRGYKAHALCYNGANYIYTAVNDRLMYFDFVNDTWHYVGKIEIDTVTLASNENFRVMEMIYLTVPNRIRMRIRKECFYGYGLAPESTDFLCWEVDYTL